MLVRELIARSWYLTTIVSRDLETVSGAQLADGLETLNLILSEKSATGRFIPYYNHTQISSVAGQNEYQIPGLVILEDLTYNIGDVRYNMRRDSRYRFWGTARVENIESLPFHYYSERVLNATTFYLYFTPSADIDFFTVTGRFSLGIVDIDDELDLFIDGYYQSYLMYLLAKRLTMFYPVAFSPEKEQILQELEDNCVDVNPMDFTVKKLSTLSRRGSGINYADVNIGRGWRP